MIHYEREDLAVLLHSLLDHIPDRIYFKDAQGRFLRVNKAKAEIHGLSSPDELVNKSDFDFFPEEFARRAQADEERVMQTGQPLIAQEESFLDSRGRQHWVSTTKSPLRDAKGQIIGTFGITRDITQHKQLESQLRQAQKMEAVGQLAGGIAHDFNNLLTIILGYTSLLLDQAKQGQSIDESVRVIRSTAERAASLTRQLLAFSRKQMLVPVLLDLNAVIGELAPMLRRLISADIHLHTNLAENLGLIKADRHQLEQVLINLVINARDAMPAGGLLTIETHEEGPRSQTGLGNEECCDGARIVLTVRDTGHGMDEHTRAHLFEPFFTTKEAGKGTGLGLATVYGIVQQSGGRITVDSALGGGATFRIELPRALPSGERRTASGANEELSSLAVRRSPFATRKETILLVEDEETLRNLALAVLRKIGYTVLEAAHGGEALAICQSHEGPIDLLVTDVVMPVLNGRELADRLALLRPATKVLYVSGCTMDTVVRNGVFTDSGHFLHKPFTPAALADKVREVID